MDLMTTILVFGAVVGFVALLITALFFVTIMIGDHHPEEIAEDFD